MSSIPQNHFNENDLIDCVQRFFSKHHVGKLLANFYRFLNSVKTNWLRFTSFLAADIVDHDIRDLTNQERKNVFIIFSAVQAVRKQNWDQRFLTTQICISKKASECLR